MSKPKREFDKSYEGAVSRDCSLLNQLINDPSIEPTVKWYRGFCEVSFTLNVSKQDYERRKED